MLNVATGNVSLHLHFYLIARFKSDALWSKAVWGGEGPVEPYASDALKEMVKRAANYLPG